MGQNQRKHYRCKVAPSRQACELRIGETSVRALLQDESAGGFSVVVHGKPDIALNQTIQLHTDCFWFHVRVVHIHEVLPPKDAETEDVLDTSRPWVRIGLRRLAEAIPPEQPKTLWRLAIARIRLAQSHLPSGTLPIIGILLALTVVIAPVGMMYLVQDQKLARVDILRPAKRHVQASPETAGVPRSSASSTPSQAAPDADKSAATTPEALIRLPGAAPFVVPEVVERLQLTAEQQAQIGQLIELTAKWTHDLDQKSNIMGRQQISQQRTQYLNQIRRKVMGLLTDDQIAEWEKLSQKQ